jgi:hypothetical protein
MGWSMDFVLEWPSRAAARNGDVARRSDHFSAPAKSSAADGAFSPQDWRSARLQEWLLLLLRFAITRHPEHEAVAVSVAGEIDTLGQPPGLPTPSFFRRTTFEICKAITTLDDPNRNAIFTMHLARIDDPRLRRAFRAAVDLEEESSRVSPQTKRRALWVSLPR